MLLPYISREYVMKYLVCGYLGYDNLGDELMADAISSSLFKNDKEAIVEFFTSRNKKYGSFGCVNRHSPIKILKSIKSCDVFILGGGTLISEEASKRSAWYYTAVFLMSGMMKKRRLIWSCGIDRISSKALKRVLKKQLPSARISLRDTASLDALWNIAVCKDARIHADPVFLLAGTKDREKDLVRDILVVCIKSDAPKDLAVMIGSFCKKHSLTPVFAATSPKDMSECEHQSALINARSILLRDIDSAKSLFERSVLCLSMRYHAILLAACFGCIPLSMSDSEKIISLMTEMELGDLILFGKYCYEKYENALDNTLKNSSAYQDICQKSVKKMLRRAELAEAYLLDL